MSPENKSGFSNKTTPIYHQAKILSDKLYTSLLKLIDIQVLIYFSYLLVINLIYAFRHKASLIFKENAGTD